MTIVAITAIVLIVITSWFIELQCFHDWSRLWGKGPNCQSNLASDSKIEEFTAWPRHSLNLSHGLLGASKKKDDKTCQQQKQRMISSHFNPLFRETIDIYIYIAKKIRKAISPLLQKWLLVFPSEDEDQHRIT